MRFLKEDYLDDLLKVFGTEFNITDSVKYIPCFLLPNGTFIYCNEYGHAEFDEFLYNIGEISKEEYEESSDGLFILSKENCVRLNPGNIGTPLIGLPNHSLTYNQYESLLKWLDMIQLKHKTVLVMEQLKDYPDDVEYYFEDYTTDDIIKKIKRYYASGNLYESLKEDLKNDNEKYYRLEVEGMGSFYRSIQKIIDELRDSDDDDEYDLGNDIDGLLGDLEAELPYPENIKDERVRFAYTRFGYDNLKNIESYLEDDSALENLKELLNEYGVDLIIKEIKVNPDKIVYRDDYQIGYIE